MKNYKTKEARQINLLLYLMYQNPELAHSLMSPSEIIAAWNAISVRLNSMGPAIKSPKE